MHGDLSILAFACVWLAPPGPDLFVSLLDHLLVFRSISSSPLSQKWKISFPRVPFSLSPVSWFGRIGKQALSQTSVKTRSQINPFFENKAQLCLSP